MDFMENECLQMEGKVSRALDGCLERKVEVG